MNYRLYNYTDGYEKECSTKVFRSIVLSELKNRLPHLRDSYNLDEYNVNVWLVDEKAIKQSIVYFEDKYKKAAEDLNNFLSKSKEQLNQDYEDQVLSIAESYHKAEHSSYYDMAERTRKRAEEFATILDRFNLPQDKSGRTDSIIKELREIKQTAYNEVDDSLKKDTESVLSMHKYEPKSFDAWHSEELHRMSSWTANLLHDIDNKKRELSNAGIINEYIRTVFEALDKLDEEEQK